MDDPAPENRRLSAIMFTDVVGYTARMAHDESGALALLARQREVLTRLHATHGGTLHKEIGDGTLSSFPSAVAAWRCAQALQEGLAGEDFRIRIGLHVGDVVVQEGDVLGAGVNLAARIEALADPGGIALSVDFHRAVQSHLGDTPVRSLGAVHLRNVPQPVEVFSVVRGSPQPPAHVGKRAPALIAAATVLSVAVLAVAWTQGSRSTTGEAAITAGRGAAGEVRGSTAAAARPAIAVLPFDNMSADPEQAFFADGISEELLNMLVRVPGLKVIARTSSFSFKGQNIAIRDIGQRLGVSHVLQGSVRKSAATVRIAAQLVRVSDDTPLWSQTFERPTDDVFKVQDEISAAIARALQMRLTPGRAAGGTGDIAAYEIYLRARSEAEEGSVPALGRAESRLREALALDPDYASAWVLLGQCALLRAEAGTEDKLAGYQQARDAFGHALNIGPDLASAHAGMQLVHLFYDMDWNAAALAGERARALDPTDLTVLRAGGINARALGHWEDSERILRDALDRDPLNVYSLQSLGITLYLAGRYAEARETFGQALAQNPRYEASRRWLAKTLLVMGEADEALRVAREASDPKLRLALQPVFLQAAGLHKEADRAMQELTVTWAENGALWIAMSHAYRGEKDAAFEWLGRAYEHRDSGLPGIAYEPLLASISRDQRFDAFLARMHLPPVTGPRETAQGNGSTQAP